MTEGVPTSICEIVEHEGVIYAEIIRAGATVATTRFFSPPESSFQFGLLAHGAGFREPAHYHRPFVREVCDLQQMFMVQRGRLLVEFFRDDGVLLREMEFGPGDAVVLIHGAHAIRVLEDVQCISVKQGPFMGKEFDKVFIEEKHDSGI